MKKGFTLIELLVVVLIIGILATIAVPQYQKAVIKSHYSTLKDRTRVLASAVQRYHLATGTYPTKFEDLDISYKIKRQDNKTIVFTIIFDDNSRCEIWITDAAPISLCQQDILGKTMRYSQYYFNNSYGCDVYSTDTTDKWNRVCQQETGKTAQQADCSPGNRCIYNS